MKREIFDQDHEAFRAIAAEFVTREVVPNQERWETQKLVDRDTWRVAANHGLIGLFADPLYGGAGISDFRFRYVLVEELQRVGASSLSSGFGVHEDIVLPYICELGNSEQHRRWLPRLSSAQWVGAIALTEPDTGSDLSAIRTRAKLDGDSWVLSGSKTFITNGSTCDLVIVAAKTDSGGGAEKLSLFVVECDAEGFSRGRKLEKLGLHAQDTAELFFDNVRVPRENLLGEVGSGFRYLMERLPRERMTIAILSVASARAALNWTIDYTKQRSAFGRPIAAFQNTQFTLADLATDVDVLECYIDRAVAALNDGSLSAVDAAKAKLAASETQNRVVDACLQLFGGNGYMLEYPIARAFADARVQTIYGGTSEIMRLIIGREVTGLRA